MIKSRTLLIIFILFVAFTFSSCFDDQASQNSDPVFQGARIITSVDDLPTCSVNTDGQLYYITSLDEFQYCNGSEYMVIDLTGPAGGDGSDGADGNDGADGASIAWQGMLDEAPQSPQLNWAYTNTLDGNMYLWNGTAWKVMMLNPGYKLNMARIPAGSFNMGQDGIALSNPVVSVNISEFYISKSEITYKQFHSVYAWAQEHGYSFTNFNENDYGTMGDGSDINDTHTPEEPVANIGWGHAIAWCNALSELEGKTPCYYSGEPYGAIDTDQVIRTIGIDGCIDQMEICVDWDANGYRLPTEAEWEYAARGGNTTSYFWGDGDALSDINLYAWYTENSDGRTHEVGLTYANDFGLYDTAGNLWEWCFDDYDVIHGLIDNGTLDNNDPVILIGQGTERIIKGGSWYDTNESLLPGNRNAADYYSSQSFKNRIGFRPCRRE